jgi:hypothetical protein
VNTTQNLVTALVLTIIIVLSGAADLFGQRRSFRYENYAHHDQKVYHFGFSLGFNRMDFALKPIENFHTLGLGGFTTPTSEFDTLYSVLSRAENGFNIGIVSNLKLAPQWDLRFIPTLSFGDRNIIYHGFKNFAPITRTQQIESTFLDFPLHLKYKSVRMTNSRVFVIGGFKYSYDLASAEDKEELEDEVLARIKKNDFYYEMGVGFEYYFYYFKFATEIKASFGLRDILARENNMFSNSIDRLNSKIIMVSFTFE